MLITSYFLKRLNFLYVEQIIQFDNLCVIYNLVNGLATTNAMDLFQPAEEAHRYETRSNIDGKFQITKASTKKLIQHFQTLVPKYGMRFLRRFQDKIESLHVITTSTLMLLFFKVVGIRPMTDVLNTSPPEGI